MHHASLLPSSRRYALTAFAAGLAACGGACAGTTEPDGPRPAIQSLPRALTTQEQQVQSAANAFTFALLKRLAASHPDETIFASPLSASFALGMAMNGAAGQTQDEMRTALQFGSTPIADINAGYKSLMAFLPTLDESVTMRVANSVWYRKDFPFNQPYLNTTHDVFNATITPLDFANVSASLGTINGWVDGATEHKIPAILDDIDANDVMFLINAIYFKAGWRTKFDVAYTSPAAFHGVDGDHHVPFMHRDDKMPYAESETYQAVDLPYGDSAFTMTVVLPTPAFTTADVIESFTPDTWALFSSSFHARVVNLSFPKLELTWERDLNDDLDALGMHLAFQGGLADFTPMSSAREDLYITQVKQKAFVKVDEEGTEAAAVTSVGVGVTSAPMPTEVNVNRPFLFVIRERLTGTILFVGRVTKV